LIRFPHDMIHVEVRKHLFFLFLQELSQNLIENCGLIQSFLNLIHQEVLLVGDNCHTKVILNLTLRYSTFEFCYRSCRKAQSKSSQLENPNWAKRFHCLVKLPLKLKLLTMSIFSGMKVSFKRAVVLKNIIRIYFYSSEFWSFSYSSQLRMNLLLAFCSKNSRVNLWILDVASYQLVYILYFPSWRVCKSKGGQQC